jgi:uncharacterized protein (TIGR03083 family)
MTHVDQARCCDALAEEFGAIDDLLASLTAEQWSLDTACPGWDVRANVAHIVGVEAMLLGEPTPSVDIDVSAREHVRNDIGRFNEAWVAHFAGAGPAQMLAAYRARVAARLEALGAITPEQWQAEGFTPRGQDTYGRFMRLRVMDLWMHEQDIREAVDRPGHDTGLVIDLALDEFQQTIGDVIEKQSRTSGNTSVTIALTGPSGRDIHVLLQDQQGTVVDSLTGPATTTLTLTPLLFTRLVGGRNGADASAVVVAGNQALGRKLAEGLGMTP